VFDTIAWRTRSGSRSNGFTLIEILVVVVLLGILAAIVFPQLGSAAEDGRRSALKQTLHRVRQQLQVYHQHHGGWPNNFGEQMLRRSNQSGDTADNGSADGEYPYGPYLNEKPNHPFTGGSTIGEGSVGSSDWYYNPDTGVFKANDTDAHRAY